MWQIKIRPIVVVSVYIFGTSRYGPDVVSLQSKNEIPHCIKNSLEPKIAPVNPYVIPLRSVKSNTMRLRGAVFPQAIVEPSQINASTNPVMFSIQVYKL